MAKKNTGKPDEQEKARKLTAAEEKRLARFEARSEEMIRAGYVRKELTVGIMYANVFAVVLVIPVAAVCLGLFFLVNRGGGSFFAPGGFFVFCVLLLVLIVVHELIHGITWAAFAEHGWKDIEFGIMWQYLTPYCTCTVPLGKTQYIIGALMPLLVLGILPAAAGILFGSFGAVLMGIIMIDAAAGDILIVRNILQYKAAGTVVYMDHPTQAGGVIFEKKEQAS